MQIGDLRWSRVTQLAGRQFGHVKRVQLLALGYTPVQIRRLMKLGLLVRVHAGVYAIGHVPRHAPARAMAAVLACGDMAALSHAAAVAHWGVGEWPRAMEVSDVAHHRRPGIRTHRVGVVEARVHQGIRVTVPVRTVLDLQPRLGDPQLVRLVNDLRLAGHLHGGALQELVSRSRRVWSLLGDDPAAERPTRSLLEDLFLAFATRHHLPMPEVNVILAENGREVDALYRAARLIIEVDSWRFHSGRTAFERDRAKDAAALALGYRTLRITARRLTAGGDAEAQTIRRVLAG